MSLSLSDAPLVQALTESVSTAWADKQVAVTKTITKGGFQGISVEQSDITLSGDVCTSPNWRTICLESGDVGDIERVLQWRGQAASKGLGPLLKEVPGSIVEGYPAFIMAASHKDSSPPANMDTANTPDTHS